jgi:nucleotide-binding universal stress UspA family protein
MTPAPSLAGALIGVSIILAVAATVWWMLHPPVTRAEQAAKETEAHIDELIGSVVIVFSDEIHSEHMTTLAARLARRERAELFAAYIIEVPLTLPMAAEMIGERREAMDVLATAEAIARANNVDMQTEIVPARKVSDGVMALCKRKGAQLIVMGSYREGKYSAAPLGKAIEEIAARAPCDVLIGVQGTSGKILTPPAGAPKKPAVPAETAT